MKTRFHLLILALLCFFLSACAPAATKPAAEDRTESAENDDPPGITSASVEPADQKEIDLFDGRSLDGWRVVEEADFRRHGDVTVEEGEIRLAAGQEGTGVVFTGDVPQIDYEIDLEAKRLTGRDFFCGLTFPVREEFCTLILGGWGGGTIGLSNVDGLAADENETRDYIEFENDRWYSVRLRVTKERITVWLDDESIIDLPTAERKFSIWIEQEPLQPLGIATWSTGAAVRNVRLTRLAD